MIDHASPFTLFAQTRLRDISLQLQEEVAGRSTGAQLWLLVIPLAAVAIGWIISRFTSRPRASYNTPVHLFTQLQRVHRVNKPTRKLLARIAEEAELAQPATMLLGASAFDQAVERASHRIRLDRRQQIRLAQLRRQLFAA